MFSTNARGETEEKGVRELVPFSFCASHLKEPKVQEQRPIMFSQ